MICLGKGVNRGNPRKTGSPRPRLGLPRFSEVPRKPRFGRKIAASLGPVTWARMNCTYIEYILAIGDCVEYILARCDYVVHVIAMLYLEGPIFNERAARRSRSTSRFGFLFIYLDVPTCSSNSGATSKCNYDGFR